MVVERTVSPGEYVRPDSRVVTLVAVDALRVELTVPEADVGQIKVGQAIDFKVPALVNGARHKGVVKYIGPAVRQQSRDAIVEAVVENPGHDLRPGMFVSAQVALGERPTPAVPATAISGEGNQRRVFVAQDGRIEERLVQAGPAQGGEVPILDGVKVGDQVVATLTPEVRDGARVK
jgi:membrane fusion protein (multidrug efflux system)